MQADRATASKHPQWHIRICMYKTDNFANSAANTIILVNYSKNITTFMKTIFYYILLRNCVMSCPCFEIQFRVLYVSVY